MSKPGFLQSLFSLQCPRCRSASLFHKPFEFKTAYSMPKHCPNCGQRFEPEPGFYYGAMFIGYIFSGFLWLGIVLTLVFAFSWSVEAAMLVVVLMAILLNIYFFRLARSIWIHMIVPYDPKTEPASPLTEQDYKS